MSELNGIYRPQYRDDADGESTSTYLYFENGLRQYVIHLHDVRSRWRKHAPLEAAAWAESFILVPISNLEQRVLNVPPPPPNNYK